MNFKWTKFVNGDFSQSSLNSEFENGGETGQDSSFSKNLLKEKEQLVGWKGKLEEFGSWLRVDCLLCFSKFERIMIRFITWNEWSNKEGGQKSDSDFTEDLEPSRMD